MKVELRRLKVFSYVLGMSPWVRVHNQILSILISKRWVETCLQTTNSFDAVKERKLFHTVASQFSFALKLPICINLIYVEDDTCGWLTVSLPFETQTEAQTKLAFKFKTHNMEKWIWIPPLKSNSTLSKPYISLPNELTLYSGGTKFESRPKYL
jgi:hypothetical protein